MADVLIDQPSTNYRESAIGTDVRLTADAESLIVLSGPGKNEESAFTAIYKRSHDSYRFQRFQFFPVSNAKVSLQATLKTCIFPFMNSRFDLKISENGSFCYVNFET